MDKNAQQDQDEISFKDIILKLRSYIKYLQKRWLFLTICGALGGIAGILYTMHKKPYHKILLLYKAGDLSVIITKISLNISSITHYLFSFF